MILELLNNVTGKEKKTNISDIFKVWTAHLVGSIALVHMYVYFIKLSLPGLPEKCCTSVVQQHCIQCV